MDFDGGSTIIRNAPVLPLMTGFPDISQVRQFSESADFFNHIRATFNQLMESQKWIKNREGTRRQSYGYHNLEINPSLETTEFVLPAVEMTNQDENDANAPLVLVRQETFADIVLGKDNFNGLLQKADDSLTATLSALEYLTNKPDELSNDWSYHNAYMAYSVGIFGHAEDYFNNVGTFLQNSQQALDSLKAAEKGNKQDKIDEIKRLSAQVKQRYEQAKSSLARERFQLKEGMALSSVVTLNIASGASHRRIVQEVSDEKKEAKQMEEAKKKAAAKHQAETRREEHQAAAVAKAHKQETNKAAKAKAKSGRG